jgi:hypothetical protein
MAKKFSQDELLEILQGVEDPEPDIRSSNGLI